MKIAYLFGSLNRGGTESLMLDVFRNAGVNNLNAIGVYRKTGLLEPAFISSGINMNYLPTSRNIIQYLVRLRRLLISNQINIVHAQQPLDALFAYWACKGSDIKVVLTLHGFDNQKTRLSDFILRYILHRTKLNIYVSDYQQNYYIKAYRLDENKQKRVYNGISFEKLNIASQSLHQLREELQIPSGRLLIGTVGNFNEVRDQLTLCRFAHELKKSDIDFHLIFVGKRIENNAERYDSCVDFCKSNDLNKYVSFLGVRDDVPEILTQLNAFVYATDHDTFGIAVVEAMATGIPVFVNDWEVMSEITEEGKYANLYQTKDENDLVRHFLLFLHHKEQYHLKAKEASAYVRHKYSIENHISGLKALYAAL